MLKFSGRSGEESERRIIGIGLSAGNLRRLQQGQPIAFRTEEIGITGYDVMVVFGETEEAIYKELDSTGHLIEEPQEEAG